MIGTVEPNQIHALCVTWMHGSLHRLPTWPETSHFSQITQDPFVVRKCVLLVLRPNIFLPDNRPLLISGDRILRTPGKPLTQPERSSWISYYSQHDNPFLKNSSKYSFEFDFTTRRHPEDSLSVFSLLVSVNSKLQSLKRGSDRSLLAVYAAYVKAAIDAIFHVPRQVESQTSSPVPPAPCTPPTQDPDVTTPTSPTEPPRGGDSPRGQDPMDLGRQDGDVVEKGHSDLDFDFGEPNHEPEGDEEPDTINGLTFPEMKTVLQRVSDGTISDRERADAAMLMLGMAAGELQSLRTTLLPLSDSGS